MDLPPPATTNRGPLLVGDGEAGFTIIEVIVAALILAIVAAGTIVGLVGAIGDSGIQRYRSAAEALGQQNEAQLRGWTVSQLANLNQTVTKTVDKQTYTVQETGTFVSDSAGSPSCSNPSADYIETSSKVTWANMPAQLNGVTVTGLITPTAGEISSSAGVLAVQVQDPSGNAYAGIPVSVTQTSPAGATGSASGVTASNGCVLFADLPVGTYTATVTPSSGTYVDAGSNLTVSSSSPDTASVTVTAGTTAANAQQFILATPGTATFSFTDLWPTGTGISPSPAPTATSPSVVLSNSTLNSLYYVTCSNQDSTTCSTTTGQDVNWGSSAWTTTNGGKIVASPLVPTSNPYASYAGLCPSDEPALSTFGGTDSSTVATTAGTTTAISLPSIVVRLYNTTGTPGVVSLLSTLTSLASSEEALPAGAKLVVTDTGCNEHYVGGAGVSVPSGDSYLPVNASPVLNGGANDIGLLTYPGMPDGSYTVCYQNGTQYSQASITNKGSGEVVALFAKSLTTGSCAT